MGADREMTFDEILEQLPRSHGARKEGERLKRRVKALEDLCVCYRLLRCPSEKLFTELAKTKID